MAKLAYPPFHPRSTKLPMVLSGEEFQRAFPSESDYVERKRGASVTEIQRAIVAFSNSDGGVILIGVEDRGEIVGRAGGGAAATVHEAAQAVHDPGRYWIHALQVDGKVITIVSVERRSQGFAQTADGRVLVWRGARSTPLIGGDLRRFISERSLERFDISDSGVALKEADEERLQEVQHAFRWKRRPDVDHLESQALAIRSGDSHHLTVAGVLTLLRDPERVLGKAYVEVLRLPREGAEYERRVELRGPVQEQVERTVSLLMDELGTDVVVSGLRRYEMPKLPEVVLREAIANAVAHRTVRGRRTQHQGRGISGKGGGHIAGWDA